MKTRVVLENANCTRCHNQLLGALRDRERVQHVRSNFSAGCLVIEHEDDPNALLSLIRTAGRAAAVAANGERVMVPVEGHEAVECRTPKDAVYPRSEEDCPTSAPPTAVGSGARISACVPASGAWSPGRVPSLVGRSGPGTDRRGGGGVRVLSRERPAPGLVLRALRFLVRTFRVVFRVPVERR